MHFLLLAAATASAAIPTGAKVERSGYWTIVSAPPAPFKAELPPPPPPPTAEQAAAEARFWRYAQWQSRISAEAFAVLNIVREKEKGNFVDLRYSGSDDGNFRVIYSFLRDGPRTLRKYSRNPQLVGETVRWSKAEQEAAMQLMVDFLRKQEVRGWMGGTGTASNRAEVTLPLTRAEWERLIARTGFKVPDPVLLTFAERSAADLNRPLPPELARGIRMFARSDAAPGPVPSVARQGRIVLKDGCFRVSGGPDDGAHVLFRLGQQLFVDPAGYLAFGQGPVPGYARVGEVVEVEGTFAPVGEQPRITAPIRKACGPGAVVAITTPRSAAAEDAQNALREMNNTYTSLRQMWGLSERGARAYLADCAKRGTGACILAPPPPGFGRCPAGTKEVGGVCRNPQGFIRPLPSYLEPYAKL